MTTKQIESNSPDETFEVGRNIGRSLMSGDIVLLYGGLGAGKTLLTKGIVSAFAFDTDEVTSPSFALVNLYRTGQFDVYHIDLWRLDVSQDVASAVGLDEILENERAISIIEWADRLGVAKFSNRTVRVEIKGDGDEPRHISISMPENRDAVRIIIRKSDRILQVERDGEIVKTCNIVLGFAPVGDKQIEDDGKTPEGDFRIFTKNAESKYFLSLGIDYPNLPAVKRGLAAELISHEEHAAIVAAIRDGKKPPQNTALGGDIYIHGGGIDGDWTRGCIAVIDEEMQEIFDLADVGIGVTILP